MRADLTTRTDSTGPQDKRQGTRRPGRFTFAPEDFAPVDPLADALGTGPAVAGPADVDPVVPTGIQNVLAAVNQAPMEGAVDMIEVEPEAVPGVPRFRMARPEAPDNSDLRRRSRTGDLAALLSTIPAAAGAILGPSSGLGSVLLGVGQGAAAGAAQYTEQQQRQMAERADAYASALRRTDEFNLEREIGEADQAEGYRRRDVLDERRAAAQDEQWARQDAQQEERRRLEAEADAQERRRETLAARFGDYVEADLTTEAVAAYLELNPGVSEDHARRIVESERDAFLLDRRGTRSLVDGREQRNARIGVPRSSGGSSRSTGTRSSGRSSGSGGSSTRSTGSTPPPLPAVRPTAPVRPQTSARATADLPPAPSMIAARPNRAAAALGLDIDPANPFGASITSFQDSAAVARALESGGLRDQITGEADRIKGLTNSADRRAALEALISSFEGRPGGDLLEAALYDALGY